MITFSVHPRKNFYNTTKDAISKIIKRFEYICSIYNVEHSDVFVVDSNTLSNIDDAGVEPQVVKGYDGNKVITKTGVKNIFNTISLYTYVELCVYVNLRKFGPYRDAYWFVHNLYVSIYKINDSQRFPYIDEIWFFSEPKNFIKGSHGECFFKAKWNSTVFYLIYWNGEWLDKYRYLNYNKYPGIYTFFVMAMKFFFPGEEDKILKMKNDIELGKRPFGR